MTTYVITCTGDAYLRPVPESGLFLAEYDPDANDGRGFARWTDAPGDALTFPNPVEAWRLWRSTSTVEPTRPDGEPNRPLTAFSVVVQPTGDPEAIDPEGFAAGADE